MDNQSSSFLKHCDTFKGGSFWKQTSKAIKSSGPKKSLLKIECLIVFDVFVFSNRSRIPSFGRSNVS